MRRIAGKLLAGMLALAAVLALGAAWGLWGGVSNPAGRKNIGQISAPVGFERIPVEKDSFGEFLRGFPLQKRGSRIKYYNGKTALGQCFGYAVLDLPMLANTEQCADAVMRMRAEYLWEKGQYNRIQFRSVRGVDQRYTGGGSRRAFAQYLRIVYGNSNTASLRREMKPKPLREIAPGDVLVYAAPNARTYGHAVLVADVAHNARTGRTAILLAQSSTPARTMHIIRNLSHPFVSPWVIVNGSDTDINISGMHFKAADLRGW